MSAGRQVEIIRRLDGAFVEATLHRGLEPKDLLLIERQWGPARVEIFNALLARSVPRSAWPQSLHWDWLQKAPELRLLEASGFGILCDQSWQGAMLTKTASHSARLDEDHGKPLVYIDYLETAPWNWRVQPIGLEGRYKAVGSLLFREAVVQSHEEGFHGRVGLHALPQASRFYQRDCRMTSLGLDRRKENLQYFELARAQAQAFLQEGDATS